MNKRSIFARTAQAAALLLLGMGATMAQAPFPVSVPTATGSFLAGREALRDLDTGQAAIYYLDAARADWENADLVASAFEALLADGQITEATDLARRLVELQPENELAHIVLGTMALKERRYTSAAKDLSAAPASSFLGITAAILKAWAEIGQGDFGKSQKTLDSVSRNGIEGFLQFHRALMADVAGRPKEAVALLREGHKAQPNDIRLIEAYVRALIAQGDYKLASSVLDQFAAIGWTAPFTDPLRADIKAGRRVPKLVANPQAGGAEMFYGIGRALAQDGSTDLAAEFYHLGLYLNPKADNIVVALAALFENAKQYERANKLYATLADDSAYKSSAMVRIAENVQALGDRDEAIRRLHNIVVTRPENFDAVVALADQLRFAERYQEAVGYYTKALALAGGEIKKNWSLYYARGIGFERSGKWDRAEADFKVALKLNPGQPQVLNYLGYTWVDRGENLDEALKLIKKAIEWDPTDGYVVDSLGWAYYRLGRIDEAIRTLEQAVELKPADPEINDHLGDAYWQAGRKLEARFQWDIAASVDTKGDVKKRVDDKLANGLPPLKPAVAKSKPGAPEAAPLEAGPSGPATPATPANNGKGQ